MLRTLLLFRGSYDLTVDGSEPVISLFLFLLFSSPLLSFLLARLLPSFLSPLPPYPIPPLPPLLPNLQRR